MCLTVRKLLPTRNYKSFDCFPCNLEKTLKNDAVCEVLSQSENCRATVTTIDSKADCAIAVRTIKSDDKSTNLAISDCQILDLLRELRDEKRIFLEGKTKGAYWFHL